VHVLERRYATVSLDPEDLADLEKGHVEHGFAEGRCSKGVAMPPPPPCTLSQSQVGLGVVAESVDGARICERDALSGLAS